MPKLEFAIGEVSDPPNQRQHTHFFGDKLKTAKNEMLNQSLNNLNTYIKEAGLNTSTENNGKMSFATESEQNDSITLGGMATQLGINLAIGVGTFILFGFLRPRNGIVYAPKYKYSSEKKQPPKLGSGLFSWVMPVLKTSESTLIEKIGLDAVNLYWIHLAFTWIFSLLIFYVLNGYYKTYTKLKLGYFESDEYRNSLHSRTLLVTHLPSSLRSDEGLRNYIHSIDIKYPVLEAHVARKVGNLPDLIKEHEEAVKKLEAVLAKYLKDPNRISKERPMNSVSGFCGENVDSIDYYTRQIEVLEEKINEARSQIAQQKATSYGFISFSSIAHAHAAAKDLNRSSILRSPGSPSIMLAPWPKDIIWANLQTNGTAKWTKTLISYSLFFLLCFFWLIPMSFLTTSAQISNIRDLAPFTRKFLDNNKFIAGLIEAWMSPMLMALFFLLLPKILGLLSKHQGKITKSSRDRAVLSKLFLFFIINNLIIFTLTSTAYDIWSTIKQKIQDGDTDLREIYNVFKAQDFTQELAKSLVKVSTFWINYISLRGVAAIFDLAQMFSLVWTFLKKIFITPTPRNIKEFSPYLVYRYQLMYVFTTKIETGGTYWRVIFNRVIVSMIMWQIAMIGVMNLKAARQQSIAIIPLIIITILFKIYCSRRYDSKIHYYQPKTKELELSGSSDMHKRKDDVSNRFGHPSLSCELITPMVFSNVKHLLSQVYHGRLDEKRVSRRGTIKSMAFVSTNGKKGLNFEAVEDNELDIDEYTYYESQNPGYYVDYNDPSPEHIELQNINQPSPDYYEGYEPSEYSLQHYGKDSSSISNIAPSSTAPLLRQSPIPPDNYSEVSINAPSYHSSRIQYDVDVDGAKLKI
ncbi:5249_t:CDS:10 [Entrophospora sp. SA101]|nr:5249_t:CDS:10 [Entrophospora sp. SA101]